jgi:hypothetical protein
MADALDEIRRLYYGATRATIGRDFDRAIELLKSMAGEDERERATVFMEGLAEMRAQWGGKSARDRGGAKAGSRRGR